MSGATTNLRKVKTLNHAPGEDRARPRHQHGMPSPLRSEATVRHPQHAEGQRGGPSWLCFALRHVDARVRACVKKPPAARGPVVERSPMASRPTPARLSAIHRGRSRMRVPSELGSRSFRTPGGSAGGARAVSSRRRLYASRLLRLASHNVLKGAVVDAVLCGEPWNLTLDDLLTESRDAIRELKLALATTLVGTFPRQPAQDSRTVDAGDRATRRRVAGVRGDDAEGVTESRPAPFDSLAR